MADPVAYEVDDRIATITLDRPHRRNAWTGRMHTMYRAHLDRAERDSRVRAIIVTGRGDAFCVGGDKDALAGHVERGAYDSGLAPDPVMPGAPQPDMYAADFAYHFGLTKPVVAALPGPAAGVGLALACFCDIRFGVPDAKLTTAHGRLGLPAEYGLSWLLPRLIGLSRANDVLLSSRVFTTDEAHGWGLVQALFSNADLQAAVRGYVADLIANNAPSSLAATKAQTYADLHRGVRASVEDAQSRLERHMRGADYAHGVDALVHKRPPRFDARD